MTWNCDRGGFRTKAARIAAMNPDVIAVQEVSRPDRAALRHSGTAQPTFRDHRENAPYPRSIGLYSYTGLRIEAADADAPMYEFRRYRAVTESETRFQVAAVWTASSKDPQAHYRQAIIGLTRYQDWIAAEPTVFLGDFNDNARNRSTNWPEIMQHLHDLGLVSAYHSHTGDEFGAETRSTFYPRRRSGGAWHIDYCFIPEQWMTKVRRVEVGGFDDWCDLSDHVPLTVDLDI